jgi:hypothetical protein
MHRTDSPFDAPDTFGSHTGLARLTQSVIEGRSLTMSMRILGALAVFCGLVAAAAPDASAQLTMAQVTGIQRCQDALDL